MLVEPENRGMRLLERESQLVALSQYADDARRGHGRLVLLSGEAGVGKSAILEQLAHELTEDRWIWSACDGLFTPPALGPLLDVAGQLGGDLTAALRAEVPRGELFATLLQQLAQSPDLTVIAVEDIHWADEATLDVLRYLGRRIHCVSASSHRPGRRRRHRPAPPWRWPRSPRTGRPPPSTSGRHLPHGPAHQPRCRDGAEVCERSRCPVVHAESG